MDLEPTNVPISHLKKLHHRRNEGKRRQCRVPHGPDVHRYGFTNDQSRVRKNHLTATEIPQANQVEIRVDKKSMGITRTYDQSRAPKVRAVVAKIPKVNEE